MKFGVALPNFDPFSHFTRMYEEVAVKAESLGYDSFSITDHFMRPFLERPLDSTKDATLEPWTMLSYMAAKTSRIKLGTAVTSLPSRYPPILAKVVATLDQLSNGRTFLGVGAGDDAAEAKAYGVARWAKPKERVMRVAEGLSIIRSLWTEGRVDFNGSYYRVENAVLEPRPVQKPHPPIWMGSMKESMLKLTAQFADVWAPSRFLGATPEFYKEKGDLLRTEAKKIGRSVKMSLMGSVVGGGASAAPTSLAKIDDVAKVLEEYKALGCEYLLVSFFPIDRHDELIRKFASEIIPSFT